MNIDKAFWFHYNKPESKKAGRPKLTLHYLGMCHLVDKLIIKVPTYSFNRKTQPYCIIKGRCNHVNIDNGIAIIS